MSKYIKVSVITGRANGDHEDYWELPINWAVRVKKKQRSSYMSVVKNIFMRNVKHTRRLQMSKSMQQHLKDALDYIDVIENGIEALDGWDTLPEILGQDWDDNTLNYDEARGSTG